MKDYFEVIDHSDVMATPNIYHARLVGYTYDSMPVTYEKIKWVRVTAIKATSPILEKKMTN